MLWTHSGQGKTAMIWNASTGECVQALSGHAGQVMSAVFSGDGMSLLTASWDKTAMIWNASIVRFVQVRPRKAARAKARARRRGPAFEHAGALASLVSAGSEIYASLSSQVLLRRRCSRVAGALASQVLLRLFL